MTCHFYYQCNKCGHEFKEEGDDSEATMPTKICTCPKCKERDKNKQIIYCDFKSSEESRRLFKRFMP